MLPPSTRAAHCVFGDNGERSDPPKVGIGMLNWNEEAGRDYEVIAVTVRRRRRRCKGGGCIA